MPVYIVAEMSANHCHDFDKAVRIIQKAKEIGADAVKLQTYTPETLSLDCSREHFHISGTAWRGQTLFDLYKKAYMPWEWQPKLNQMAADIGIDLFSTPFDASAVDFLEKIQVPAYKIASFELVDHGLIQKIALTGKPIILSTGMATLGEIDEALNVCRQSGGNEIALLKCTSAYPASPEEMNLKTIAHMSEAFQVPVGLSDHTLGTAVSVAAVAVGACIVEKHLTLNRNENGPDSAFSMEPNEFQEMVRSIRITEKAMGNVCYDLTEKQKESRMFRRSLFAVKDIRNGEKITLDNIRSIRPSHGLHPRYLEVILGKTVRKDVEYGTPLTWDLFEPTTE